jgi:DNA-binding transcriptional MerR regulator
VGVNGDDGLYGIGELARLTGLTVRTIRFYSDSGLLPPTERTHAGYRMYDICTTHRADLHERLL